MARPELLILWAHHKHHRMSCALGATLLAVALLALAGCSPAATPTPTPSPTPLLPTPTPTPTQGLAATFKEVQFSTDDGVGLKGRVFGTGDRWVVLAHMFPADQESWRQFAGELAHRGYVAFTFNFRGYPPSGGLKDPGKFDKDMAAAIKFARESGAAKLVLIGASVGAAVAEKAGAAEELAGVVALSPVRRFETLEVRLAELIGFKSPILVLASQDDKSAAEEARSVYDTVKVDKEIGILPGSAHGTNMLAGLYGQDVKVRIFSFLERHIG